MAQRTNLYDLNIPEKANRVLNLILLTILLLIVRIWHLAVVQYDAKLEEFRKPQRKVVVEAAKRATIRDRFNLPLAINKVQYQAAILYSQFKAIPSIAWTKDPEGKRVKQFKRRDYITALSQLLADELQLDASRLEDLIHSKAAFYYQVPFVIKEDITEEEYYRLKMLEKDWLGIHVQSLPRRTYPRGKAAGDIIGYMGAISREEYETIIHEMNALASYIQGHESGEDPLLPEGIDSPAQARKRLKELQEHAYTVKDYVGKTGIEGRFEEKLRGFQGKKSYYSDARGNFLRELPGSRDSLPGHRILLTISLELQEYAEKLLAQNERIREAYVSHSELLRNPDQQKQPWIKGGAIVVMDPYSGEVLTMASYPRYDPNDFIASGNPELVVQKSANIARWFESEAYIGQIWDQKRPLERERFDDAAELYYEEGEVLTWDRYLEALLPADSAVKAALARMGTVKNAVLLQKAMHALLAASGQTNAYWLLQVLFPDEEHIPYGKKLTASAKQSIERNLQKTGESAEKLKNQLEGYLGGIPQDYDKLLLVDLCRVAVSDAMFPETLLQSAGQQSLAYYRDAAASLANIEPVVSAMARSIFHDVDFFQWREMHEKEFLKQKREEEKIKLVRYPKPYIDYLDEKESELFQQFWKESRWHLMAAFLLGNSNGELEGPYNSHFNSWHHELKNGAHQAVGWKPAFDMLQGALRQLPHHAIPDYLQTLRNFSNLNRPLLGQYKHIRKNQGQQLEKHLAAAFYPVYGYGYSRSHAFRQATIQGSIFKLVTAYTALIQKYRELDGSLNITPASLNPLVLVDIYQKHGKEVSMGYHADGKPIPQHYKGGRLTRSSMRDIGRVDMLRAIETSSNPYFSLLAGDFIENPEDLAETARLFSYGARTGIDLPAEIPGKVPTDLATNKTGLYSTAIGQHTLVVTPLQTCVMLSALTNGGKVLKPKIVNMTVGPARNSDDDSIDWPLAFAYRDSLALTGIDFPLFTAISTAAQKNCVTYLPTEVRREIFMPEIVRKILLEGMHNVVSKIQKSSLSALNKFYHDYPEAISDYLEMKNQMVGKTSTAEAVETIDMDLLEGSNTYTHVWFGGISYDPQADPREAFLFRDKYGQPELVVVVYLRFGRFGKETAPIAGQIVKKWREIKARQGQKG